MNHTRICLAFLSALIASMIFACSESVESAERAEISSTPNHDASPNVNLKLSPHERRLIAVFKRASPSVVHITSVSVRRSRRGRSLYQQEEGTGTGFVWDQRGHIVTNYHVIREGDIAQVAFTPARDTSASRSSEVTPQVIFDAQLIGVAPDRDLAVLKVDADPSLLSPLPRGSSRGLQVGQSTLAIGNPFGLDQTLTTGVISGLGREIESVTRRPIKGVIQTDAAINPGNSGGPLLNSSGEVIGVNTAIYSPSGAYAGIGFAVPVDTVHRVVPQLIAYGGEVRPSLNLELEEGSLAQRYRLRGALILFVPPDSEADRLGVKGVARGRRGLILGDLIVALNQAPIADADALYQALDDHRVGEQVTLTLQRGRGSRAERRQVKLTLVGNLARR